MRMLIFAAILLLTSCATQESVPPADFYDRNGVPCWRMLDFIWCEDGYESEPEIETTST